uniref:Uncharacterized protein n=1 Tax=Peronospora matthiolae TaxID=2874970 RepID=A0AAV1ULK8_9STRA
MLPLVSKPIKVTPAVSCCYVFAMDYDQLFQALEIITADGLHCNDLLGYVTGYGRRPISFLPRSPSMTKSELC